MEGKENRGKGEIKKTKGEENVAEKKTEEKKKKKCCVGYTCGAEQGNEQFIFLFFLSKLMKKKLHYSNTITKIFL